ncbi:MAG: HAD family hydrolase [Suilimivivens sp.]
MLKNIIFDMGNVLLRFNPEIPLNLFCKTEEAKTIIRKELFNGPEWIQGDYGTITSAGRFEPVSKRVPKEYHEELYRCVMEWDICMKPIPGALEFCEYVKEQDYRIYVLSNADNTFHDYFPRFAPETYFDGVMVSSDVHMIKPELRIYEHFLKTYHLLPEECLFIDDRPENIEGAQKTGINGYVFQGDFETIKTRLL